MSKQIFPKEILENSVEVHHFKNNTSSKIIYSIILIGILILLGALPFVNVKISNTTNGIIRPEQDRVTLISSNNGFVASSKLKNNQFVNKGDTLLVLKNNAIIHRIETISNQIGEQKNFIHDLKLLSQKPIPKVELISIKYKQEYNIFSQKLYDLNTRFTKSKINYFRNLELYKKGVVTKSALEDFKLDYDLALNNMSQYKKEKVSYWENLLFDTQQQLDELEITVSQLNETKGLFVLIATVNGTMLEVKPINPNSFVQAGQELAIISPNSGLVIESYISPNDIGFIKKGTIVKYQVSAFNYNQWGLASGCILEIGNDIQIVNNNPMFRVISSLDQTHLSLKNGYKGNLIKGMVVGMRYELTERSLFNLLYDKMDDWLNPTTQLTQNN